MNAIKLEDIARELNLSVSTVSRAISGKGRVGEKTRARVLDAVRKSDYRINEVARSLRMKTARNIGIIVPDISNGFFASVIKSAQQRCRQDEYVLIVCNSDEDPAVEDELLHTLLGKQISGLVLASVVDSRMILEQYGRLGLPIVYIDNIPQGGGDYDSVSIDNATAARRLTLAMLDRGYSEVGMITGPQSQSTGALRLEGFEAALRERGIPLRGEWIRAGSFTMESGYCEMKEILKHPRRPRAMLFANNYMAYGAIRALREANLSVPGDMAISAFDAIDDTGLITPLISSVNQPARQIGSRAVEILLDRLKSPDRAGTRTLLDTTFIEGDSW